MPELADNRFNSQASLDNYLVGFSNPENIFESLLFRPTDRFSSIVNDYMVLENAFQGVTLNHGMEFCLVRHKTTTSNLFGYVRYVIQPIVFEITNKDNQNEINGYLPGVTFPGIELGEDFGNLGVLCQQTDPLLYRTINYILTGAKGNFYSRKKIHNGIFKFEINDTKRK